MLSELQLLNDHNIGEKIAGIASAEAQMLSRELRGAAILRKRIAQYLVDLDLEVPIDLDDFHYSAVFISWCIRASGVPPEIFPSALAHGEYVRRGAARLAGEPFRAVPIGAAPPAVGDILNFNRDGGRVTFLGAIQGHYLSESGVVVAIDAPRLSGSMVVGNMPSGAVAFVSFKLDPSGLVAERGTDPFIAIIKPIPAG